MAEPDQPPWFVCEVHVMSTDTDCEYCERQLKEQQERLATLQESCQQINQKLTAMTGQPYIETATAVPFLAVQVLVSMICSDPKARMAYELNFHRSLGNQMLQVHQHAIRMQLQGGGNGQLSPDQADFIQRMKAHGGG